MESSRHTSVFNYKEGLLASSSTEGRDDGRSRSMCFILVSKNIKKSWNDLQELAGRAWEMGHSDPRKVIFATKMGLALSIVSFLIFWKQSYHDISQYSIWAILTVIVMFEFTIGATFIKGFNRGLGTFCAGILAFFFSELTLLAGQWEEVVIVISIFITACVSGYLKGIEYETVPSTLLTCQAADDPLYNGYRSVVDSARQEDTLLGFAVWEPPHGRYKMFNYPWKNYVKVSGALRHCAFTVMALHGCILSEIQAPAERRQVFRNELQRVGAAGAKVLLELGRKVQNMEKLGPGDILGEVHEAAEQLQKKIDKRSYILVNSESWEIGRQPKTIERLEDLLDKDKESVRLGFKSLSESVLDLSSLPVETPLKNGGSKDIFRKQIAWPLRHPFNGDAVAEEDEYNTYESASAMSLGTFVSLVIEFVARLQNVVDTFEELSEKADFEEPFVNVPTTKRVGFWIRLFRCYSFKY